MKKIILLCAGGMSTSILVNNMKKAAVSQNEEFTIAAYAVDSAKEVASDADCVLLGPQVDYRKEEVKQIISCPVTTIDMMTYGMMDGKKALQQALDIMRG